MALPVMGYKIRMIFANKSIHPLEIGIGAKIEISGTKWVEKTLIYISSTVGWRVNEFEQKKLEKNEKIPKT